MARFNDDNAIRGNSMNTCQIGPAAIPQTREAARRGAAPLRFNFVARAKFDVAQPIPCRL